MAKMVPGLLFLMAAGGLAGQAGFAQDVFPAKDGEVTITFVGHATLVFQWGQLVVHVDPVGEYGDYAKLPKADLVLVTHDHFDHLDAAAIEAVRKQGTEVVLTAKCAAKVKGTVMANGDRRTFKGSPWKRCPPTTSSTSGPRGNPITRRARATGTS